MRYAIYFSPPQDDPLTRIAAGWLGRCAFCADIPPQRAANGLSADEIAFHTAAARRYGFHATLMAPFKLAEGEDEQGLIAGLDAFCEGMQPFFAPPFVIGQLDGFFALVPERPGEELDRLAGEVVQTFDRFRAPLSEAEKGRRGSVQLTRSQLRNLMQWGYPYIFDDFRFHMTLTGRVHDGEASRLRAAIEEHFGPVLGKPVEIASLALFLEPEPGAPFIVRSFHEFQPSRKKRTA